MANTEKWRRLGVDDLRLVLAEDEIEKLSSMSVSEDLNDILQKQVDMVADSYRAAMQSKGYIVDIREHYIPNAYKMFVLNLARYQIWTRFPNSKDYALGEEREASYDEATEYLKDPKIGPPIPDYSDDPELSGRTDLTAIPDDIAITMPNLQLNSIEYGMLGIDKVYYNRGIF